MLPPTTLRHTLRLLPGFLSGGVALILGGCATTHEVKVEALAKPEAVAAVSYQFVNRNPHATTDSLRHREAEGMVRTALSGKGLYEAPEKVEPDIVIEVDYGIKPPIFRRETISEPIWIRRPVSSGSAASSAGLDPSGNPVFRTRSRRDSPSTEIAGYREYHVTVVVYEKYVRLTARQNAADVEGRPPLELWSVDVTSEGESRDLRRHLPVLVAASIDYIGRDTQGPQVIRLKDTDADVAFVRKGM